MKEYKRLTDKKVDGTTERYIRVDKDYILSAYDIIDEEKQDWVDTIINRLAELEDKIENKTLIELPCKVGDTVYWVCELVKNKLEILEGKIRGLSISQNNTSWFSVIYEYGLTFEHIFKDYWNKTVFPTKAEAEKKLKELQNER